MEPDDQTAGGPGARTFSGRSLPRRSGIASARTGEMPTGTGGAVEGDSPKWQVDELSGPADRLCAQFTFQQAPRRRIDVVRDGKIVNSRISFDRGAFGR